jgi:16S rRNA (adenine1518-N6/adenine1519-N6)-dimethyltransferase
MQDSESEHIEHEAATNKEGAGAGESEGEGEGVGVGVGVGEGWRAATGGGGGPPADSRSLFPHKKSLGQHFLRDRTVPPRIADAAGIQSDDLVVEIGPGLGILTEELASRLDPAKGRLVAIELDDRLLPILRERFADRPHVVFVHADVLETEPAQLADGRPYKVVANLPYYITSAVLRHFLDTPARPRSLTVMVQREVADRMTATPPDMNLLAVAVQFYGRPVVLFRVPPGAFSPPPRVESAVVHIDVYAPQHRPVAPPDERAFFRVVQAGFSQKRKQLANALASGLGVPRDAAASLLRRAGIEPSRRAETLSLQEWAALAAMFSEQQGVGA